jgi:hypothetical protein
MDALSAQFCINKRYFNRDKVYSRSRRAIGAAGGSLGHRRRRIHALAQAREGCLTLWEIFTEGNEERTRRPGFSFVPFVIFCLNPSGQRQLEAPPSFLAVSVLSVSP